MKSSSTGEQVTSTARKDAADLGIEVVYQDLALCDNLDVVQNMYLGREATDAIGRLKETEMEVKTAETMKGLAVTTIRSIRQKVASLSGGQRQSVAVARAVMWNSRLVILDEPTAALGVAQTRQVLELVKRLAPAGPRGGDHLPQPPRRVRGRGPDHGAPPREEHRDLRARGGHPAEGGRGDHRGCPHEGRRSRQTTDEAAE